MEQGASPQFQLGEAVYVELWQRVPPETDGDWKNTGRGFAGTVVNGPSSRSEDPQHGYWYVMPDEAIDYGADGQYASRHPRPISGRPFTVEAGEGDGACQETLRFVVAALHNHRD